MIVGCATEVHRATQLFPDMLVLGAPIYLQLQLVYFVVVWETFRGFTTSQMPLVFSGLLHPSIKPLLVHLRGRECLPQ